MIPQINILTVVDVIGALSAGTLTNNLYMMDNRRGSRTSGLGTGTLSSDVTYTQVLNWHVIPVDFQTDIQIRKIAFYRNGAVARANTPCARKNTALHPASTGRGGQLPELIEAASTSI
jgi:hypothetical protein